jgi:hypothetical protein
MRQYRIASWILLIHSIINFTLAAPVAVGDKNRVRVNVVDVALKDRMAVLQERMDYNDDPDDGQSSDLTSEYAPPGPDPDPDPESDSDSDSESESESESDSDSDDSDGGEAAQRWDEEYQDYEPSDNEEEEEDNHEDDDHMEDDSEEDHGDDNHEGDDSEEDDHEQSPPQSPESHPAASTYDDLWSKLLKDSMRSRASTSGAIDASKRGLQETDDTRAYVSAFILPICQPPNNPSHNLTHKYSDPPSSMARDVSEFLNAPTTSTSSVTGRGGATSLYSPATGSSRNQNRKRWSLDRLD